MLSLPCLMLFQGQKGVNFQPISVPFRGFGLRQIEQDALRTARLNELGYQVIRFTNEEVFENSELVVLKIKQQLDPEETIVSPVAQSKEEIIEENYSFKELVSLTNTELPF